ncbi:Nitroreductase [Sinosporangium album]|uniref:Nitroreductase n=1 Tax=Sinosporangium album TaxID=504805 RepID=A0A1G8HPS2_9ACTN|nr:nitroreductase family protein [Sinosporangium album]SDI08656.1 Nitroreductase [Sinosporangium album]
MRGPTGEETTAVLRGAIGAALWAPSVHNTQPWSFGLSGGELSLRADVDRLLRAGDVSGREMLVSCGAALCNVQMALLAGGHTPEVRVLPDPDRPNLLATVRLGEDVEADEHSRMLFGEVERRRTHRGGFTDVPVPDGLIDALVREAAAVGVRLTPVLAPSGVRVIAALTAAAEEIQEHDLDFSLELLRWARPPGDERGEGVPAGGYPAEPETAFAQRDYAHGKGWGYEAEPGATAGTVAVLTTVEDRRKDWLAAGQALQRVLLRASASGVSAAFHTQALEMHHLREFLREELLSNEHPQMIMRLGVAKEGPVPPRRALDDVLDTDR